MASGACEPGMAPRDLEDGTMVEARVLPAADGIMTFGTVREPAVFRAMAARARARFGVTGGPAVAVEAAQTRVTAGQRQVTGRERPAEDPPKREMALAAIVPAPVGRGVARLARLGRKRSAFDVTPDAADNAVECRSGVEVDVRVRVGDRTPRHESVAFAALTKVGELVPMRVRVTPLGGAPQTHIERGVGRTRLAPRHLPLSPDNDGDDDGDDDRESKQGRRDPAWVPRGHATL